jgi:RNA polymerase sigma-70 factor, ECF subfamily
MNPVLTDRELVTLVRQGQTKHFQVLVERHLPALIGFFHFIRVSEEMIDDMMQETFLRAFKFIDRYDGSRSFTTWLTVIGRNAFYSELKKRGRQQPPPTMSPSPEEASTPGHTDDVLSRETARELLDSLDEESRFLVELRIFRDLPFAEISEITGETVAALRVRFHRLLKRLRVTAERVVHHDA